MIHELELTKANRLKLARAFRGNKRVDCSIDCVIEGQMGKAYGDDLDRPSAYRITVGPFWYFAGEPHSVGGHAMMKDFPAYHLLMPSPDAWLDVAREIHGDRLRPFTRYRFSSAELSQEHLASLLAASKHCAQIIPINAELAAQLAGQPESYLELSDFDSVQDFIERGIGYTAMDEDKVMGAAYSSLVCSTGIEVSIYVEEQYRRQGVATVLASRLLLECLRLGLRPNWDAANPESCKLAKKLGYVFLEAYDSYYYLPEQESREAVR
jgi:GNAT superfamily N-acetyltransferase